MKEVTFIWRGRGSRTKRSGLYRELFGKLAQAVAESIGARRHLVWAWWALDDPIVSSRLALNGWVIDSPSEGGLRAWREVQDAQGLDVVLAQGWNGAERPESLFVLVGLDPRHVLETVDPDRFLEAGLASVELVDPDHVRILMADALDEQHVALLKQDVATRMDMVCRSFDVICEVHDSD